MYESEPLVTIAILFAAALVGGMIAHRLRQPVILGYILIGIAVGPHALGLVSDLEIVEAAAAMGVALLMFSLGLEISISQLREVGRVGLWGGIAQIGLTLALGMAAGVLLFDWSLVQAILFGLITSLSSTAVCLKVMIERGELNSVQGRIMLSILILQDIAVVLMMVVLPVMGGNGDNLLVNVGMAMAKAALFVGLTIVLGRWVLPWLIGTVGRVRTRELFLLTVLVSSLGAAVGTHVFGLSMVFGAFLVGVVIRQTRFAHQALAEITPLRDVFATLFFVSLGMLLDPAFVLANWPLLLMVVASIVIVKFLVVFVIVRLFGYSIRVTLITSFGLFQIGEFGFILAQGGVNMGLASSQFYSLILGSAIITMLLTPLAISLASQLLPRLISKIGVKVIAVETSLLSTSPGSEVSDKVIIAGYGRVGHNVAQGLADAGIPYLIVDLDPERIEEARCGGSPCIYGDAVNARVLREAGIQKAKVLVITYPDPVAVVTTAKIALNLNPKLKILARIDRAREAEELKRLGVKDLINPEYEASFGFLRRLLSTFGVKREDRNRILSMMRRDEEITEFYQDDQAT